MSEADSNRALALRFLELAHGGDQEQLAACVVEDFEQVFPRPGIPGLPAGVSSRDELLAFLTLLPTVYEPGSMRIEVENVVAEGPMVVVQFEMTARTAAGEPYQNHYVAVIECRDGKVAKGWEYCDTLYAAKKLVPDLL